LIPIKKIGADFYLTILRFPIPILTSIIAFALFFLENHFVKSDSFLAKKFVILKILLSCITAISSFIAFDIYTEHNRISSSTRLGFLLLVFCLLGLHYYTITPAMFDYEQIFLSRYLIFIVIFHLMVSVSAYVKEKDLSRFWQFNQFLLEILDLFPNIK
jgi:FtsH-binding integral membrane protein